MALMEKVESSLQRLLNAKRVYDAGDHYEHRDSARAVLMGLSTMIVKG